MSVPEQEGLLRLYDNGDAKGGLKFFVNKKLSIALGITAGDRFTVDRDGRGVLTLTPCVVEVQAERHTPVALPEDPFLTVWRESGQRKVGGQFHRIRDCPQRRGAIVKSRQDAARIAGAHPCTLCWIQACTPPGEVAV